MLRSARLGLLVLIAGCAGRRPAPPLAGPSSAPVMETPARVARMYAEMFSGLKQDPRIHTRKFFTEEYDEVVLVRDISFCSRSPAIPPRVDFRLIGEDGRLLLVDLAANGQPFRFPPADGTLVALQIHGNFLPRVQPVISGLAGMNLRQGFARTH